MKTDFGEAALIFATAILIIFCTGSPDLIDALIYWLMKP